MLKSIVLSLLLILLSIQNLQSQNTNDHVPGEVIVCIKDDHNIYSLLNEISPEGDLFVLDQLCPQLKIWLLKFSPSLMDENLLLEKLQQHPGVESAQFNHFLELRGSTMPDDPLFNLQWQYVNDGSGGGTPDADIDMDLAWGITTGGKTRRGEDIVIAVIDVGFDLNHPDFSENIWINTNEIPGNGIDEDNNGYVDDQYGWNCYYDSPNIDGGSHGTSVSGIIGAKGNNDTGVSGINWNIKLMTIVGGGKESDAIKAYNYVYVMRKMYNETQGLKGAYIVASNSSWGRDREWSGNNPLWCNMYDLMGAEGVLNVAATTNSDYDVDVEGDMPSTCPSEYLIVVTNTDKNDVKAVAGYGKINVDLGAPGQNVYTTRKTDQSPPYEYFKGTSASSPMVAGVVGLLYAACCQELLMLGDEFPDSLSLLMKQFLLKGTDHLTSLYYKTVSSGRLNAYHALLEMQKICEPGQEEILTTDFEIEYDCMKDSVYLTNLSHIENGTISEYSWTIGSQQIRNVENPVVQFYSPGDYRISLKASTLKGTMDSAVKDIKIRKYKSIYPLPVDDKLMMEVCSPGKYSITLTDLNGRMVLSDDLHTSDGHLMINTLSLRPGLYVLQIKSETLFIQEKVLKLE